MRSLRLYLLLAILQGSIAFWGLLSIPGESQDLSVSRLALLATAAALTAGFAALLVRSLRDHAWVERSITHLTRLAAEPRRSSALQLGAALLALAAGYFTLRAPGITEPYTQAYFVRLAPLTAWLAGMGAQTLVFLPLFTPAGWRGWLPHSRRGWLSLSLVGVFGALWAFIALSGLGLQYDALGRYSLGAPLLETQVALVWVIGTAALILQSRRAPDGFTARRYLEWLLPLGIWLGAVLVWSLTPLTPSWFLAAPRAPSFTFAPNSDALIYDTSGQSLLVGHGLSFEIRPYTRRPLLSLFMAFIEAAGGLEYLTTTLVQIMVLAGFPVLLYWLGRRLHSLPAGVMAAGLLILREANAISAADIITTSHARLLMSDLPTTLMVTLLVFLLVRWVQDHPTGTHNSKAMPLLVGLTLGATILIRMETAALAGPLLLVVAWNWRKHLAYSVGSIALVALGAALVISPWIIRNYRMSGEIFLDEPVGRAQLIGQRFNENPTLSAPQYAPGETSQQFTERMTEGATDFILSNPGKVIAYIANHYLTSQSQLALGLPSSFRLFESLIALSGRQDPARFWQECCTVESYMRGLPYWDETWNGSLPPGAALMIAVNLVLLAIGLSQANERGLAGWIPLLFSLTHLAVNAIFRNSGGRYILPADWIAMLYFGIGLAQVTQTWLKRRGWALPEVPVQAAYSSARAPRQEWQAAGLAAALALLVGSLPVIAEQVVPPRYTAEFQAALVEKLWQSGAVNNAQQTTLAQNLEVFSGRALYPRFYPADDGEPGVRPTNFTVRPYARTAFMLSGPLNLRVQMLGTAAPQEFPHGADVLVFGCLKQPYFNVMALAVFDPASGGLLEFTARPPAEWANCLAEDLQPPVTLP